MPARRSSAPSRSATTPGSAATPSWSAQCHDNSVVVGVPGQVIARTKPHTATDKPDLHHEDQPDLIGQAVAQLLDRVDKLEHHVTGHVSEFHLHSTGPGQWEELEDFSI